MGGNVMGGNAMGGNVMGGNAMGGSMNATQQQQQQQQPQYDDDDFGDFADAAPSKNASSGPISSKPLNSLISSSISPASRIQPSMRSSPTESAAGPRWPWWRNRKPFERPRRASAPRRAAPPHLKFETSRPWREISCRRPDAGTGACHSSTVSERPAMTVRPEKAITDST